VRKISTVSESRLVCGKAASTPSAQDSRCHGVAAQHISRPARGIERVDIYDTCITILKHLATDNVVCNTIRYFYLS
jgi:hypothetical protein